MQAAPEPLGLMTAMARSLEDLQADGHYATHGFWKRLAESTGVPSARWRNFFSGNQNVTPSMIEAAAKVWPEHAFWLATGVTDAINGHIPPVNVFSFPERLRHQSVWSRFYFRKEIELHQALSDRSQVDYTDPIARRSAALRVPGSSGGGDVVGAAYELCRTDNYDELRKAWKAREQERASTLAEVTASAERAKDDIDLEQGDPFGLLDTRLAHQSQWDQFYEAGHTISTK